MVGENDKFVRATMDQEMNVSSEVHMPLGLGIQGKLNMQLGKQDVVMGTASYTGGCANCFLFISPMKYRTQAFRLLFNLCLEIEGADGEGGYGSASVPAFKCVWSILVSCRRCCSHEMKRAS